MSIDLPRYNIDPVHAAEVGKGASKKFSVVNNPHYGAMSTHSLKKIGFDNEIIAAYTIRENEIVFSELTMDDSGVYIIRCQNKVGEGFARFTLHVKGIAQINNLCY